MTDNTEGVDKAIVEYFELLDRGEVVDPDQFVTEHEEVADQLREFFEAASVVQQMAGPTLDEKSNFALQGDTAEPSTTGTTSPKHAHDEPPQIVVPCQFGRYRVERELGQGAMGSVYLAHDTQLEREVALKIPGFDEKKEPEMIDRFYREAQAAAMLRSPHICPVYDVDQIDGVHFITMAYIDGQPLSRWMARNSARSPRRIATIVYKLALALEKAHEAGVIHRDLKPSNIMIDAEGEPVVMDFGLARRIDQTDVRATKAGSLIGTPAYMSPEQIMGDSDAVGPISDVYALGVILYELLTGKLPFQGSVISVIGQIIAGKPKPPAELQPGVDPRLAAVCRKMMAKRIEDRYQSMADVATALEDFLHGGHEPPFDAVAQVADPPIRAPAPYVQKTAAATSPHAHQPLPNTRSAAPLVLIIAFILAFCLLGGCFVLGLGYFLLSESKVAQQRQKAVVIAEKEAAIRQQETIRQQQERLRSANEERRGIEDSATVTGRTSSSAPTLRYDWQPERSYGYSLRIAARRGSLSETLTGTLRYRVLESSKKEVK
jgi:predicted Ser/Thr protein kinase